MQQHSFHLCPAGLRSRADLQTPRLDMKKVSLLSVTTLATTNPLPRNKTLLSAPPPYTGYGGGGCAQEGPCSLRRPWLICPRLRAGPAPWRELPLGSSWSAVSGSCC